MRLICPNCDAEYEVDDAAIPMAGRDVQCSNCGHGWFQSHPEVEAEQEAAVEVAPQVLVAADVPETVAVDLAPESEGAAAVNPVPGLPLPPSRGMDESVMAVLREEAAREAAIRKTEGRAGIETQTELGLVADGGLAEAAVRRIARLNGEPEPQPQVAAKTRREMLPAIEEINSTLRATSERRSGDDGAVAETMEEPRPARAGFGRGFVTLVVLAVVLLALYLLAPLIAAKVPALAGAAQAYVAVVDAGRRWLDTELKALVATLRGYQGSQGG